MSGRCTNSSTRLYASPVWLCSSNMKKQVTLCRDAALTESNIKCSLFLKIKTFYLIYFSLKLVIAEIPLSCGIYLWNLLNLVSNLGQIALTLVVTRRRWGLILFLLKTVSKQACSKRPLRTTEWENFTQQHVLSEYFHLQQFHSATRPDFFLRSSCIRVNLVSYERKTTDKQGQNNWMAEKTCSGSAHL